MKKFAVILSIQIIMFSQLGFAKPNRFLSFCRTVFGKVIDVYTRGAHPVDSIVFVNKVELALNAYKQRDYRAMGQLLSGSSDPTNGIDTLVETIVKDPENPTRLQALRVLLDKNDPPKVSKTSFLEKYIDAKPVTDPIRILISRAWALNDVDQIFSSRTEQREESPILDTPYDDRYDYKDPFKIIRERRGDWHAKLSNVLKGQPRINEPGHHLANFVLQVSPNDIVTLSTVIAAGGELELNDSLREWLSGKQESDIKNFVDNQLDKQKQLENDRLKQTEYNIDRGQRESEAHISELAKWAIANDDLPVLKKCLATRQFPNDSENEENNIAFFAVAANKLKAFETIISFGYTADLPRSSSALSHLIKLENLRTNHELRETVLDFLKAYPDGVLEKSNSLVHSY